MKKIEIFLTIFLLIIIITTNISEGNKLKEAMFYQTLKDNKVQCALCPRECIIAPGKRGFCRVRENKEGKLYTLVYSRPCSLEVSPIEKAPFYHFLPGHKRLCLATVGCNLRCLFCQNWHISQASPSEVKEDNLSPEEVIKEAKKSGVTSLSFTFTEPIISYEYILDICKLAKKNQIRTSIVSNGYINAEPLKKLLPYLDAVKVDLKAFSDKFYDEICGGAHLNSVLSTLRLLKKEGAYFEIVNLVIPTLNDSPEEIKKMCVWIKENLGEDVPLHFSRFHPSYKLTSLPPTPIPILEKAYDIAKGVGLNYVYVGNVPGHKYNSTFCPKCNKMLIHRVHFSVLENNIKDGKCKFCAQTIYGIWK